MIDQPDSPVLVFALGAGCAAASYACHRLVRAIEGNTILPLSSQLKGDKGIGLFRGVRPFKDKYQLLFVHRSVLHALLLIWKWGLAFVAALMVLYPIFYLMGAAG